MIPRLFLAALIATLALADIAPGCGASERPEPPPTQDDEPSTIVPNG